jgi:hypothetical protein
MSALQRLKLLSESAIVHDGKQQGKISLALLEPAYFTTCPQKHIADLSIIEGKTPKDLTVFKFSLYLLKNSAWTRTNIVLSMSAFAAAHFTPIAEAANVPVS